MEIEKLKSVLESLLFVSGEPIKALKLAKICEVAKNEVESAMKQLESEYQKSRGLRIVSKNDSFQFATNPENQTAVSQLVSGEMNAELSQSAMETLAIIAYRGPITRMQIEAIRGVNCSYVLRSLLLRGVIERKETADVRGYIYETSFEFLKNMGLEKISQLPDWENLSKNEKISEFLSLNEKSLQENI